MPPLSSGASRSLDPERAAYWYFRLNGFLQIENFVVHPGRRGSQRTDADLLGVRFPNRREFLFDHDKPMQDDVATLRVAPDRIDMVIAEIKANGPCRLNGPWTDQDERNVDRVLAAIGCLHPDTIRLAATAIYETGEYRDDQMQIRLAAVGREASARLSERYRQVIQLTWNQMLAFMWHRFEAYRSQKRDVQQWDLLGRRLKAMAGMVRAPELFIPEALRAMGIR
jgi:hypothetical protein